MDHTLARFLEQHAPSLERALERWLPTAALPGADQLDRAIHATIFPGGKRMRPFFTLLATQAVGGDPHAVLPLACAVEYLHACSLVLDDLPAMDDAPVRRGRPAVHCAFGEGTAILASLALFNQAWLLIADHQCPANAARPARLASTTAAALGPAGMIGGQMLDLRLRQGEAPSLRPASYRKTTGLMRLALTLGPLAAGATPRAIEALGDFGEAMGAAYQAFDDALDRAEDGINAAGAESIAANAAADLGHARAELINALPPGDPLPILQLADWIFDELGGWAAVAGKATP